MESSELPFMDMLIRLSVATGFGFLLGLERELRGKPAGLRSHMLVAMGAAAFVMVGMHILFATATGDPSARIDPTRIVEGVIGGIGFLGAGCIIQARGSVQGITTGASIWIAGAVGVASGIGNLSLAALLSAFALITIAVLGHFEKEVLNDREEPTGARRGRSQ
ncbi:putative Mg2+ transporter-C (MgtC) family protein [Marinobacter segnicrescens]|uniref:Protein MgtC n=1 Tax=Marinobacter segnicrescens TaxID=430453 RepID=A0A1I0C8R8_9GAMM|nr:MgtC/SapB family protein [Marinobacter segnicrescens]SET15884.1 putative Mg2+ transporter-C (MgtC) family protein [Marinobacter segnicrescens]